jgi:AraC-like DNA-binding protein
MERDVSRLLHRAGRGGTFFAKLDHFARPTPPDVYFDRDYWEITAIVSGTAIDEIRAPDGSVTYETVEPGQIYMWRPQDVNVIRPTADGIRYLQVGFAAAEWFAFLHLADIPLASVNSVSPPRSSFALDDVALRESFRRIIAASESGRPTMLDLIGFWGTLLPYFSQLTSHAETHHPVPSWLARGIEAMQDEENLRGGLKRLVELAHVSPRQLARVTRDSLGMAPHELIADLRIQRAANLLRNSSESIGTIARRVGFSDQAYFTNSFRRIKSVTPTEYRRGGEPNR